MFEQLLAAVTGLTSVLGSMAAYIGLKAFKRGRDASLLFATAGFTLITGGTVFGAIGCVFLNINDVMVHIAQSAMVAVGLFSIIYSISRVGRVASPSQDGRR